MALARAVAVLPRSSSRWRSWCVPKFRGRATRPAGRPLGQTHSLPFPFRQCNVDHCVTCMTSDSSGNTCSNVEGSCAVGYHVEDYVSGGLCIEDPPCAVEHCATCTFYGDGFVAGYKAGHVCGTCEGGYVVVDTTNLDLGQASTVCQLPGAGL